MIGKFAVYLAGRGSLNVQWIQRQASSRGVAAVTRRQGAGLGVLGVSSIAGIPPFYAVSFMCGVMRMPAARFLAIGVAGRAMRFTAVFLFPALFR